MNTNFWTEYLKCYFDFWRYSKLLENTQKCSEMLWNALKCQKPARSVGERWTKRHFDYSREIARQQPACSCLDIFGILWSGGAVNWGRDNCLLRARERPTTSLTSGPEIGPGSCLYERTLLWSWLACNVLLIGVFPYTLLPHALLSPPSTRRPIPGGGHD